MKKPVLLSFLAGTIRPAPGQVSPGWTLALLLHTEGKESWAVLQVPHEKVWDLQDACSEVAVFSYGRYIAFMAKSQSLAAAPSTDDYLRSLPPSDAYAVFHRRQKELALPQAYLQALQPGATVTIRDAETLEDGLHLDLAFEGGAKQAFVIPHDVAFLLNEALGNAVLESDWKRSGWLA